MNTVKCTIKYIRTIIFIPIIVGIAVSTIGCVGSDKENRPSPLVVDSVAVNSGLIKIEYSSPRVRGRKIWDTKLVSYGKVWRTGANDATIFSSTQNLRLNDQFLKAGEYALFTIPTDSTWTVIFSNDSKQWGAYNHKSSDEELRLTVTPSKSEELNENMEFILQQNALIFQWEYLTFRLNISSD